MYVTAAPGRRLRVFDVDLGPTETVRIRARDVGLTIGWDLRVFETPASGRVGLVAGANDTVVLGLVPRSEAVVRINAFLDQLLSGEATIVRDFDGDPYVGGPVR